MNPWTFTLWKIPKCLCGLYLPISSLLEIKTWKLNTNLLINFKNNNYILTLKNHMKINYIFQKDNKCSEMSGIALHFSKYHLYLV